MVNYRELYFKTAGTLADAIEELDRVSALLKEEQMKIEAIILGDNGGSTDNGLIRID
jgi:hypothetical protein